MDCFRLKSRFSRYAGIEVISTCNVQHVESIADAVETILGVPVRERIPDEVVRAADEIEPVDMSPHALRQRMRHGNVYPPDRAALALERFFTETNLTALRDLSLRFVAGKVDDQLEGIVSERGVRIGPVTERVMALVDESQECRRALRRAASIASALHVRFWRSPSRPRGWAVPRPASERPVERRLRHGPWRGDPQGRGLGSGSRPGRGRARPPCDPPRPGPPTSPRPARRPGLAGRSSSRRGPGAGGAPGRGAGPDDALTAGRQIDRPAEYEPRIGRRRSRSPGAITTSLRDVSPRLGGRQRTRGIDRAMG